MRCGHACGPHFHLVGKRSLIRKPVHQCTSMTAGCDRRRSQPSRALTSFPRMSSPQISPHACSPRIKGSRDNVVTYGTPSRRGFRRFGRHANDEECQSTWPNRRPTEGLHFVVDFRNGKEMERIYGRGFMWWYMHMCIRRYS